jgi:hypothetical protein
MRRLWVSGLATALLLGVLGYGPARCVPVEPSEPILDIVFVMENRSDQTVFVQQAVIPEPSWLAVTAGGEPVLIVWDCGMPCHCDPNEGCMVCGMLPPYVTELAPGEEVRLRWDGTRYLIAQQGGRTCFDTVPMAPQPMSAEFCYGFGAAPGAWEGAHFVTDQECVALDFEYGAQGEVRLVID